MDTRFKDLRSNKKIYLASDFHLGAPNSVESRKREEKIIRWLSLIEKDAQAVFLLGDIFDFWFDYSEVIPKGFVRFQSKIIQLTESGIPVYFFTGNHDIWMFDYFEKELGVKIIRKPVSYRFGKHSFHIGHGDGLGPGDHKFKFFRKIFTNKIAQWGFKWIHPDLGVRIAKYWSHNSSLGNDNDPYLGENEWIFQYCKGVELSHHHDYYVFGHRHLKLEEKINETATYINLGEWVAGWHYLEVSEEDINLKRFEE